jgi:secreted PhoX family phosphatase
MDGTSYELPSMGKASWENVLVHPNTGARTVAVGLDDSSGTMQGQVYVYVGHKTISANPVEAAGLTNGELLGIQVSGVTIETGLTVVPDDTPFTVHHFGNVSMKTGAEIELESRANGVTAFQRPEDGSWDPSNPNDFYFVTTATFSGLSRLWRLRFADPSRPELGGTISMLLDGNEEQHQHMMDNLTINRRGEIFIQEDPGASDYLATIWRYTIATDTLQAVAKHDRERFTSDGAAFLTNDEESSGIIDASDILGEGWFLDVQAPYNIGDAELVAGGQLLALHVPPGH